MKGLTSDNTKKYLAMWPCVFVVWGPPLSGEDFLNGQKVQEVSITEETRQAIRAGIESESLHKGTTLLSNILLVNIQPLRNSPTGFLTSSFS